ncbi:MAG: cupredoxin domain-containing protein [Candidatus Binatia bacterium]
MRLLLSLFVLGACGLVAAGAHADEAPIALAVEADGFAPTAIEAAARTSFRIAITNKTDRAIEFESFELNRERVVQPGQTVNVYLSDLEPGRYEFFDDFNQQRRGALLVK